MLERICYVNSLYSPKICLDYGGMLVKYLFSLVNAKRWLILLEYFNEIFIWNILQNTYGLSSMHRCRILRPWKHFWSNNFHLLQIIVILIWGSKNVSQAFMFSIFFVLRGTFEWAKFDISFLLFRIQKYTVDLYFLSLN